MKSRKQVAKAYFRHACQRAEERYGITLTVRDVTEAVAKIQANKAVPIWSTSGSRTAFKLDVKGQQCAVVYSRTLKTIVTFLPKEVLL